MKKKQTAVAGAKQLTRQAMQQVKGGGDNVTNDWLCAFSGECFATRGDCFSNCNRPQIACIRSFVCAE